MTSEAVAAAGRWTILGGSGFVGSRLTSTLRRLGRPCDAPHRDDATIYTRPLGHVIYAIGLTADFRARPFETIEAHVCVLRRVLQDADFESLTYLSSTRVYAGAADTSETADLRVNPNKPGDLYNLSKLAGESLCLHCGRAATKVARLSNLVGLRADPDTFIDQLLEEGARAGRIELQTTLESKKDYLAIDDAVDLLLRIAVAPGAGIYNVASGEGVANADIVRSIASELGIAYRVAPGAASWDFNGIDVAKVRAQFGFSPRPFRDYFPEFLHDHQKAKRV